MLKKGKSWRQGFLVKFCCEVEERKGMVVAEIRGQGASFPLNAVELCVLMEMSLSKKLKRAPQAKAWNHSL